MKNYEKPPFYTLFIIFNEVLQLRNLFYTFANAHLKVGVLYLWTFTPLKNSIRTADESSTKLPVTDLYGAHDRGADSNLHWFTPLHIQNAHFVGRRAR